MAKRKRNGIPIKDATGIAGMRVAGKAASKILQEVVAAVEPGRTTKELDDLAGDLIKSAGGHSAFLGYRGFPANTCISVNEEVVHGIGGGLTIKPGDIVSIDVGISLHGWIGDNATTVPVGDVAQRTRELCAATEQSLYEAIDHARAGKYLADLCGAVEAYVKPLGFTVVREFVGHGVGATLHEEPSVPNYRPAGRTPKLLPGMILAIEPMVNEGVPGVTILDDGWTVVTNDRRPSAHYEHTVLITDGEPEILTDRPRLATREQLGL